MKTKAAYYDFPFDKTPKSYNAKIIEYCTVNGRNALILDTTIFYPEGGGQPADRGTINGIKVTGVSVHEGEVLHFLEKDINREINTGVELQLDAVRRRDITVQHSGQHLLSGLFFRLAGIHTVSMHLGEQYNTIDLNTPLPDSTTLLRIEDAAAAAIEEDHPFITHLCPPALAENFPLRRAPPKGEEELRIIEIETIDFSACCGTHVSGTGKIGMIRILGAEKYKGMTRLTFIAGRRCLEESRMLRGNAVLISQILSAPVEETGKAAQALLEKTEKYEEKLKVYKEEAAHKSAEELAKKINTMAFYAESFPGRDMEELLQIGKQLQKMSNAVIVLGSEEDLKFTALCSAKGADIREQFKTAVEKAEGKGGGGPSFFQGQFTSAEKYHSFFAGLQKMQGTQET